ncbi:MAG: AraC family transcriptional regulator [Lysobacteraceae bacterium]|nr:MAG: AraC family transcriptional regulator [Xanthomonadaceae bacterium]
MQFWSYLFTTGAVVAAVLAIGLWQRQVNRRANRLLAAWLIVLFLDLAARAWYLGSGSDLSVKAYGIVQFFPFIHGSALFLYVSLLTRDRPLRWTDLHVLLGFIVVVALNFPVFFHSAEQTRQLLNGTGGGTFWFRYFDHTLFTYSLSYVAAALVVLTRHHQALLAQRSDAVVDQLAWVRMLAFWQLSIWGMAVLQNLVSWVSVHAIYATVTIWLLLFGSFSVREGAVPAVAKPSTEKSLPPSPRWDRVEQRLLQLINEQAIYTQAELTIAQLAERVGAPEYLVSAVINQRFGQTFYDFINGHRVQAACQRLVEEPQTNILDIALDCGFASKTTFNTVFKRQTSMTPSAWRRQALAEVA